VQACVRRVDARNHRTDRGGKVVRVELIERRTNRLRREGLANELAVAAKQTVEDLDDHGLQWHLTALEQHVAHPLTVWRERMSE